LVPPASTIQSIREIIKKELLSLYPDREIDSIVDILCQHRLDLRRHEIGMRKHEILMPPDAEWFREAISKLKKNVPVQYITGDTEFLDLHLSVSPAALIPRPETEELVKWIIEEQAGLRCKILDIGTGTGCIALSLARGLPTASVYATDLSEEALDLARDNSRKLGINVDFILHDIRTKKAPEGLSRLDLIVSNPPYIPAGDKESMDANVLDYEPATALFVPDEDPLVYYRHIAVTGKDILCPGGLLYLEIHENFGEQVIKLLENSGFEKTELRRDINGKDRMIRAINP
jgi:release factor glutamine methyltransferase